MLQTIVSGASIKPFMAKLFQGTEFSGFEVRKIEIKTITKFSIDGQLETTEEEAPVQFCTWAQLQPYALNIIKGSVKPRAIKIIFALGQTEMQSHFAEHANDASLFLNIAFDGDKITLTTGYSQKTFTLDKTINTAWDAYITQFLAKNQIEQTEQPV